MAKSFSKLRVQFEKMALATKDNIDIDDFITVTPCDIKVIKDPFPHVVVDNFFKPDVYQALCDAFDKKYSEGLVLQKGGDSTKFHAFEIDYDGYLFIPKPTLDPQDPIRVFYSLEWNAFFSKIFHQFTGFETSFAFHHHPSGDKTGFVHHDFANKPFSTVSSLPNGVIGKEDSVVGAVPRRRVISLLIYLNNPQWQEGDGGETGIYSPDGKTLLKKVPPVNNRLFAFKTSPLSMHAFQSNKKNRNCMVQWFHMPPEWL